MTGFEAQIHLCIGMRISLVTRREQTDSFAGFINAHGAFSLEQASTKLDILSEE